MTSRVRKFALTAHVAASVGALGAVAAFLVLSIAGLTSKDPETVRGAYLAMDLLGWLIVVPLIFGSLLTGIVQSLGTPWGLLRHYWVIVKLLLTFLASALLLLHQYMAVSAAAKRVLGAAAGTLPSAGRLGTQLVVDASLAILVLLTATTLGMYKPRGVTSYGRRKQPDRSKLSHPVRTETAPAETNLGYRIFLIVLGAIAAAAVVVHLMGLAGSHGS
jgi:hypothetical protein